MARPPSFAISVLADLLHQLRYAPAATRKRQMDAAEQLVAEIEPHQSYPEDYILFRITSFRLEHATTDVHPGAMWVADLTRFIEGLSIALNWPARSYKPRVALPAATVMERLSVGWTTLHRYRRDGLVAHHVLAEDGRRQVVVFEDALARFVARRRQRLAYARRYTRLDASARRRIIRRARRYAALGLSLNEAAARIAARFGRSHEGIRKLLQRHDRLNPQERLFSDHGPLTKRQRAVILRAVDRALPAALPAKRYEKTPSTIYRAAAEERADRLRNWSWSAARLPTFDLPDAEEVILGAAPAARNLPVDLNTGGVFSQWSPAPAPRPTAPPLDESIERQLIAALNYLLHTASLARETLPRRQPRVQIIDLVETRLRWATRIKVRLLELLRPALVSTLEIHVGRRLEECPLPEVRRLYEIALRAASGIIDAFDPTRQPRLAPPIVHALRLELARLGPVVSPTGARARHDPQTIMLPDIPAAVYPWRLVLELPDRQRPSLRRLDDIARAVLTARYGMDGTAPKTLHEIAAAHGLPYHRAAALERRALYALRRIASRHAQ